MELCEWVGTDVEMKTPAQRQTELAADNNKCETAEIDVMCACGMNSPSPAMRTESDEVGVLQALALVCKMSIK